MTNQLTYEGFWDGLASFDESVLQSNGWAGSGGGGPGFPEESSPAGFPQPLSLVPPAQSPPNPKNVLALLVVQNLP